jgi:hypothetical protein
MIEARKIILFYMGLTEGLNKSDDASGKIIVRGTMDRGFTVYSHIDIFVYSEI